MAKKHTKLFPTPTNFQTPCLPGTSFSAKQWLSQITSLLSALPAEERDSATLYITAERGVEVWYYKTVSDAEINLEQEQILLNALLTTKIEDMSEEWRNDVIARYWQVEKGDAIG